MSSGVSLHYLVKYKYSQLGLFVLFVVTAMTDQVQRLGDCKFCTESKVTEFIKLVIIEDIDKNMHVSFLTHVVDLLHVINKCVLHQ